MLILIPCPECGDPAEVTDRFALASTDGPVGHLALQCAGEHKFRMPADSLPADGLAALREQEAGLAAVMPLSRGSRQSDPDTS